MPRLVLVSLFETKDGFSPIRPNGFKLYWEREMPQLKGRLDSEAVKAQESWGRAC